MNNQLITELPQFVNLAEPFLDPCFDALIRCQAKYASDVVSGIKSIESMIPARSGAGGFNMVNIENELDIIFSEMKQLSIVSHSI